MVIGRLLLAYQDRDKKGIFGRLLEMEDAGRQRLGWGGISWFSSLKIKLERQGLRWLVVGLRGRELIGYKMMEMRLPGKGKRGRPERINICTRDWRFVSTTVFSEQS